METFTTVLNHVAEPQTIDGRDDATHTTLSDYQALWFAEALIEYANYGDHKKAVQADIAKGYVEFINKKIRDEGRRNVNLYTHTDLAIETLMDALIEYSDKIDTGQYSRGVGEELEELFGDLWIENVGDREVSLAEDR